MAKWGKTLHLHGKEWQSGEGSDNILPKVMLPPVGKRPSWMLYVHSSRFQVLCYHACESALIFFLLLWLCGTCSQLQLLFQAADRLVYNPCRGVVSAAGVQGMWKHSCGVLIPITTLIVPPAFCMESLEPALSDARTATDHLDAYGTMFIAQVGDYFIHSSKRANLYEYVLTSQPVQVDFADWLLTAHTKWI